MDSKPITQNRDKKNLFPHLEICGKNKEEFHISAMFHEM